MRWVRFAFAALLLAAAASAVFVGPASAADINITYANNAWSPNPATAHVGDHLHFCNASDAPISVAVESFSIGPIAPNDCEGNLIVEQSDVEAGALSYHCVAGCSANGVVMIQDGPSPTAAPTATTMAPRPPPTASATTRRPTGTTARRTQAPARPVAAAPSLDVTTTSEDTTTTFFDTTTSEFTTTTAGQVAINEDTGERAGENGTAVALLAAIVVIGGGGGYLLWRNRYRYS